MTEKNWVEFILQLLQTDTYIPMKQREIANHFSVPKNDYKNFRSQVNRLLKEKKIILLKGNRIALQNTAHSQKHDCFVNGIIQIARAGFGFLSADHHEFNGIKINYENLGSALHQDEVRVHITKIRGFWHGNVVEVVKRAAARFVGIVLANGNVCSEDIRNPYEYKLDTKHIAGSKVLVEVITHPDNSDGARCRVIEQLGPAGEPDTETKAILANYDAPIPFSSDLLNAAQEVKLPMIEKASGTGSYDYPLLGDRLDLRELIAITIDPHDARDHDDALSYTKLPNGCIRAGVHIADVAAAVLPGSLLDREARERGVSIYLPERVIPMLPEELSTNICSLRPNEDRFAITVFIDFDKNGIRQNYSIHRSVIHNYMRLSYNEVLSEIEGKRNLPSNIRETILELNMLAQQLRELRFDAGSIDFDVPEYKIIVNEKGESIAIKKVEQDVSHQLVEEFMLAANRAIAEWCINNGVPILHRIHEPPSEKDMDELALFYRDFGLSFKPPFTRQKINNILHRIKGLPEERAVKMATLRSFKQAMYGADGSIGHFALNFDQYTHFTSPIRRYPDLYLHQTLNSLFPEGVDFLPKLLHKKVLSNNIELIALGDACSKLERRAMMIERDVNHLRRLELLNRTGKRNFAAVVTGIKKFGVFVELDEVLVEGLIPKHALSAKGFQAREEHGSRKKKSHRTMTGFYLGDRVHVHVKSVDLSMRTCELDFLGLADHSL